MRDRRLFFGPLAATLFLLSIVCLAALTPGYDPVRQTVSEIGEVGAPMHFPFTAALCAVAVCTIMFGVALADVAKARAWPRWPAALVAAMGVSAAGVGVFSYPHPLHNVFGLSELVGYSAPAAVALAWRGGEGARAVAKLSAVMSLVIAVVLAANLIPIFRDAVLWPHIRPVLGLVQRALFVSWFSWLGLLGVILAREDTEPAPGA